MAQLSVSQLKPLPGYVLVEPAKQPKQTTSGIYLPDSHDEKPQHGTVLACGAETVIDGKTVACPVKKGQMVLYKKWGGNELSIDDIEYQFLRFDDLLAVVG